MKYFKTLSTSLLSTAALCAVGHASISVSLDLESLKSSNGDALPSSGVAVLVVSADDAEFSAPMNGAIIPDSSDDQILAMWDLSDPDISSDAFSLLEQSIEYNADGGWSSGDPIGLYWFPDLDSSDPTPSANEAYGFYRDSTGELSGDVWELPEDGVLLHSLKLFTADSNDLVSYGEIPDLLGYALLTVGGDVLTAVTAPTSVSTDEATAGEVVVSWSDGDTPLGALLVERRIAGTDDWVAVGTAAEGDTSYTDDTVGRGKDYEYRVLAINGLSSEFSDVFLADTTLRSNLINIATRGLLGSEKEVMIAGFVTEGDGDIEVLAQTVGPGLETSGIADFVADPESFLFLGADLVASNDNWSTEGVDAVRDLQSRLGATVFADESLDSSMVLDIVADNAYTIISLDKTGEGGVALVEVYDAFDGDDVMDAETRLINISTRGKVGTDSAIMIGGFVIKGEANMTVLLRGSGPGLVYNDPNSFDTSEVVPDPTLTLFRLVDGAFVEQSSNNDWGSDSAEEVAEAFATTGAFAFEENSADAALVEDLEPGIYTVFLAGATAETGIGLFEIYEVAD